MRAAETADVRFSPDCSERSSFLFHAPFSTEKGFKAFFRKMAGAQTFNMARLPVIHEYLVVNDETPVCGVSPAAFPIEFEVSDGVSLGSFRIKSTSYMYVNGKL